MSFDTEVGIDIYGKQRSAVKVRQLQVKRKQNASTEPSYSAGQKYTQLWRRTTTLSFFQTGIEKIEIGFLPRTQ